MTKRAPICPKRSAYPRWRLDPVSSALECRIEPRQKVVQVRGDDAHPLLQSSWPAAHDKREGQHGPGKVLDRDLDDDKGYAFAAVVGGIGVGKGEDKGVGEDVAV